MTDNITNRSGGVDFSAGNVNIGNDVVGRDKITTIYESPIPIVQSLHQLPTPPADFVGRTREIEDFFTALQNGMTISGLYGMGGIGKTALALVVANKIKDQYPDAQFFLDMRGVNEKPLTPSDAMAQIVRAYYPTTKLPDSEAELSGLYHSALDGKRVLILLDNAKDAEQVKTLVSSSSCFILVTSRQHFHLPGLQATNLDALLPADARALLLQIAHRIGEHANEIAQLCSYLPLALRLAGGALFERIDLSPADYIRRLTDTHQRLKLTGIDASLHLSYDLLTPPVQQWWCQLTVFPLEFDQLAATYVWFGDYEQESQDKTQDMLSELVKYSMLVYRPILGENPDEVWHRYYLNDLAHIFASTRLANGTSDPYLRFGQHCVHTLATAQHLYSQGHESVLDGIYLFEAERFNIREGQAWAAKHTTEDEKIARICSDFGTSGPFILDVRLNSKDRIQWFEAAVLASRYLKDAQAESYNVGNLGLAYLAAGQTHEAIKLFEQELALAHEAGNQYGIANTLTNLGLAHARLGNTEHAIDLNKQALVIAQTIKQPSLEGVASGNIGSIYIDIGEPELAMQYTQQWLLLAKATGDKRGEARALGNLGNAYFMQKKRIQAYKFYNEARAIAHTIGDERLEALTFGNLGNVQFESGNVQSAKSLYERQLALTRAVGDRQNEGKSLMNLGILYGLLGYTNEAIDIYNKALAIFREVGDTKSEGDALWNTALILDRLNKRELAIEAARDAQKAYTKADSRSALMVQERLRGWKAGV